MYYFILYEGYIVLLFHICLLINYIVRWKYSKIKWWVLIEYELYENAFPD